MNVTQPSSVITVVFETLQCLVVSLNRVAVIGIVCERRNVASDQRQARQRA